MHSKENHKQTEKIIHRVGKNICKQCNWQGVNLQNIQTAHEAQYEKKNSNQKLGRRSK